MLDTKNSFEISVFFFQEVCKKILGDVTFRRTRMDPLRKSYNATSVRDLIRQVNTQSSSNTVAVWNGKKISGK